MAGLSSQSGQEEEKVPEGQEAKGSYLTSFLTCNFKVLTFGHRLSVLCFHLLLFCFNCSCLRTESFFA